MFPTRPLAQRALLRISCLAVALCCAITLAPHAGYAQTQTSSSPSVQFHVSGPAQRLEMIVNTSRILTLDYDVPRLLVNNTELLRAVPLKTNQIQVSALKPGVTQLAIWDSNDNVHSIDVWVYGDARELENLLHSQFPEVSKLKVSPINNSVILTGFVPKPDTVSRIVRIAEDYYPKVHNNLDVGGAQTVLLHVKVMEVSRTKLRRFGVDWAAITGNGFIIQSVSGLLNATATQAGVLTGAGDTIRFGILDGNKAFGAFLELLKQNNLAKLLSEPTLVTISGRPARFNSGGQVPVPVPAGLGVVSIQYREFGTAVDFVPIVLGNGMIRLEVRPEITEVDPSLAVAGAPGFRSRTVDTGVEMRSGQTLALAGLIQNRLDSEVRGIPWLSDLPWIGAGFRHTRETMNEVELLVLVTPELVAPLEANEVPPCGPGQSSQSPTDVQLYWKGYIEVPGGCPDNCLDNRGMNTQLGPVGPFGPSNQYEEIPAGKPTPAPNGASKSRPAGGTKTQTASQNNADPGKKTLFRTPGSAPVVPTNKGNSGKFASGRSGLDGMNGASASNPTIPDNPSARNGSAPARPNNSYGPKSSEPALIGPIGYGEIK